MCAGIGMYWYVLVCIVHIVCIVLIDRYSTVSRMYWWLLACMKCIDIYWYVLFIIVCISKCLNVFVCIVHMVCIIRIDRYSTTTIRLYVYASMSWHVWNVLLFTQQPARGTMLLVPTHHRGAPITCFGMYWYVLYVMVCISTYWYAFVCIVHMVCIVYIDNYSFVLF